MLVAGPLAPHPGFSTPDKSPGFLLWRATLAWQRQIRQALTPHDLTHVGFVLLACAWWLADHDRAPTQIRLAAQAGTDPMMTSQVIRRLQQRGLVTRRADPDDSRAWLVEVSPAGRRLLAQALADVESVDRGYFHRLGERLAGFNADLRLLAATARPSAADTDTDTDTRNDHAPALPDDPWCQHGFDLRFDWGRAGAQHVASNVDVAVVVDVLSFTTCVDIAVARGATVCPAAWDESAAADPATVIAVKQRASTAEHAYSLAPSSLTGIPAGTRLVLASPNGATLCRELDRIGAVVIAGCLRNATAVTAAARSLGKTVAVIAAGEQWPDGALRPAIEDLAGAGAILGALPGSASPEARVAIDAAQELTYADLVESASARELIGRGYASDVTLAFSRDASAAVPLLRDGWFANIAANAAPAVSS